MAEGRTTYWAKDTAWWRRERIVMLGAEFGPAGPAVIDWLSCEADAQRDQGRVKTGLLAIDRGSFVNDVALVKRVIDRAIAIGVLDDHEQVGPHTFVVRVSGWRIDQNRAAAARRQAARRAESRLVTPGHGESREVREGHDDSQRAESAGSPQLSAVGTGNGSASAPQSSGTESRRDSQPLSRSVTASHPASRSVTESHVKPRPDQITTPPQPPASGGRRRDQARRLEEYQHQLAAFLADHPCCEGGNTLDEWQQIIEQLPEPLRLMLHDSHPHTGADDGTLLIGVAADALSWVKPRFQSDPAGLLGGRRIEFLACPSLERSAA